MSLATLQGHAMALALSVLKRTSDGWEGIGEVVTTRVTNSEAEPGHFFLTNAIPVKEPQGLVLFARGDAPTGASPHGQIRSQFSNLPRLRLQRRSLSSHCTHSFGH